MILLNTVRFKTFYQVTKREKYQEKVRYNVIGVEMKGVESSMKLVALGATQRKGLACMVEEWIRAPKYGGRRTNPCLKGNE